MKKFLYSIVVLVLFAASIGYSQVTTLWEKSAATFTKPYWDTGSLTRGISYGYVGGNNLFFVVTRHADLGGKQIIYYNALTGDSLGQLDNTGIVGGVAIVNDVEVSSNGKIFVSNMTTNASADAFKVYMYDSLLAAPVTVISYNAAAYRLGDKFTVTGSTADNSIVIWAANAAATGEILKFTTTDNGVTFTPTTVNVGTLVSFSSAAVGPLPNGDFYFNAHGMFPQKFNSAGTLIGAIPGTAITTSGSANRYLNSFLGDEYIVANDLFTTTANNAKIIKVPGSVPASATLFASTPMLGSTSAGGLGDVSVQKVSDYVYNVYVLATNNGFGAYQVDLRTPLAADYFIPQGANPAGFATLNDAVASLNINGASAPVNFILDADTLRENSFTINAALSDVNNLVIKPAPGRDVALIVNNASATVGNGPFLIGINSGYVTFDGSNNGTDSRNLLVTTEQLSPVVDLPITLNNANADNVTLKNLIIKNIVDGQTNFRYGAVINDLGGVMDFRVENCQIGTALRPVRRDGLAPWGSGTTGANQFSFVNNEIFCGTRGIATYILLDSEIIGNTINILPTTAAATDSYNHGIYITGHAGVLNILGNTINCLEKTINVSSYLVGIAFAGNSSTETDTINVFNNFINVGAADETRYTYGIGLRSANPMGNLKVYFNTILINDNASALVSHGIGNHTNGTGPVNVDLKDNIIINNHTGNAGSSAIGLVPATSVLTSDYNDLLSNQNLVNYQGTLYADLTAWQATTQDLNSVSKAVNFVSATDLHLTGTSDGDFDLAGTPIAGITTDIDGDTRGAEYPYKGADEATPLTAPLPEILLVENFEYGAVDDTSLVTLTSNWVRHSGIMGPAYSATSLSYPGYLSSGIGGAVTFRNGGSGLNDGDIHRVFTPVTNTQDVYASFLLNISSALPTADYFFHLGPSPIVTTFRGRVYVRSNGAGWSFGLAKSSDARTDDNTILNLSQTYLVVLKYAFNTDATNDDLVTLYVYESGIPATEPGSPIVTIGPVGAGTISDPANIGSVAIRQGTNTATGKIDGIRITTTWGAVVIPVELTSFIASANGNNVLLNWSTATETNNSGFEVERKSAISSWTKVGFVPGLGTTTDAKQYSFADNNLDVGTYSYRLKQIDFNGTFEYSKVVEVDITAPSLFDLAQNYPNPFNPNTVIEYSVASPVNVTLTIYSVLGEQVAVLVNNQFTEAGKYSVQFNASNLASGTYIYRLQAGDFVSTKKMLLMK